ncbi:glutamylaminopeptidase, partial [Enterococcus durans]|nr:glutamylaminopeptidase [Enterococcus durans]NAA37789.1 glutamylaminopeptidase [Enterococcus durans]
SDADAPRVMLAAHMDEVGFMLTQITERGLFSFSAATSEKSPLTDNTKG